MEIMLIVIVVLMLLWGPALASVFLVGSVTRRVRQLERQLADVELQLELLRWPVARQTPHVPPAPTPQAPEPTVAPAPVRAPEPPALPEAPSAPEAPLEGEPSHGIAPASETAVFPSPERLVVWIAAGIGGFALVLTALFALVIAIERGWLGPSARVCGGLVLGTLAWLGGTHARRRWPWAGSAVAGAGIGTLYGTFYAAAGVLELLSSSVSGAWMVVVTALASLQATRLRSRFVAWLALLGGLMTPLLISSDQNRPVPLFLYLALLCTGVILQGSLRRWPDLLVGAALGAGTLHLGWSAQYRAATEVPAALFGVLILSAPFALASARCTDATTRRIATGCAAALTLLAAGWVIPIDPMFVDPRSGLTLFRTSPLDLPLAALATALLPAPLVIAARWNRASLETLVPALGVAAVLALSFVAGWGLAPEAAALQMAGVVLGPCLAALLALRSRELASLLSGWLGLGGFCLYLLSYDIAVPAVSAGCCVLLVAGTLLVRTSRHGGALAVLLAACSACFYTLQPGDFLPGHLAGPALALLMTVLGLSVRSRWEKMPELAHLAGALAPLAVFLPLYRAWRAAFGDALLGLLPLLLGALALLALLALRRRVWLAPDGLVLAVWVGIVLLGASASVPLQLEERWLTVIWALQAAGLAVISGRVRHNLVRAASVALCAVVGARLLLNPWALSWGEASEGWVIFNWTLYTWGVPLICLLLCARWLPRPGDGSDVFQKVKLPLGLLAVLVGFALVNVEVSHAFQEDGELTLLGSNRLQSMVRSASWALYGMAVLGLGLWRDHRVMRLVGFAFVLLAAFKVFGHDLWDLAGLLRVASLGCLALCLIAAALLFERLVLRGSAQRAARALTPAQAADAHSQDL